MATNIRKSTFLDRHGSTSPLAHKQRRVECETSAVADMALPAPLVPGPKGRPFEGESSLLPGPSAAVSMAAGAGFVPQLPQLPSLTPLLSMPPSGHPSPSVTPAPVSGLELSLARLEAESHNVRLRQAQQVQGNSLTATTYERHIRNYRDWWTQDQAARSESELGYTLIPAFPVTAAKVALFLQYETTREKVGGVFFFPFFFFFLSCGFVPGPNVPLSQHARGGRTMTVPNSTIGKSVVAQAISALENWRLNHHHLYKDNIEAQ